MNHGRANSRSSGPQEALEGADFIITAIQVGGFDRVVPDYEIPKKYGLYQTYADTLGIGGLFRGLRTAPVILDIARDMELLCPNAWLLNYVNPMAMTTGAILKSTNIRTVGLCHSVQICASTLLEELGLIYPDVEYTIAGVNHQAWLLKITSGGRDLYPIIKEVAAKQIENHPDRIRLDVMQKFGYYLTESSIHTAEYLPYYIKKVYPNLAASYGLDTDMYKTWKNSQSSFWNRSIQDLLQDAQLTNHTRTEEYCSHIIEAMLEDKQIVIGGNVLNNGCINNLPQNCCVEVPCIVDGRGITPQKMGNLPPQCAGLNRTYVNPVELAIEAILTHKKEHIYHAAFLDPHTSADLTADEIVALCDEMLVSNHGWIPDFK